MAIPKKPRKCRVCKADFQPSRPLQNCCSPECALIQAKATRAKAEMVADIAYRKVIKIKLEAIKPKAKWAAEAQTAVNAYRREVFKGEPCISCGKHHTGQYHAGHFISRGSQPALRYEESNIWLQCQPCNVALSGNLLNYRKALIARIGIEKVEWLEGPHEPKKYTIPELQAIKAHYTAKLKELKNGRS